MKKWLVITLKNKQLFEVADPMFTVRIMKAFEKEILDGKINVRSTDWDDKEKGSIVVEMDGTEEEIKAWTKKSWREKIGLGIARAGMKIDIIDV